MGPRRFLGQFEGILQTDGYAAYDQIGGPGMVHAACWADARRQFFEAVQLNPRDPVATPIVAQMDKLFAVDAEAAESRHSIQAAGPTGPRDHTYLRLGVYDFYGRSVQRFSGTNGTLTAREPFYRLGGDFDFGYHGVFNLYGLFMYGHDHDLVPIAADGTLFPVAPVLPIAFIRGVPATFSGGFMQADYMLYPWMMLIMRWDSVHSTADLLNGTANFPLPFNTTRNRFTPGVQFLIHANIKASFEYQIRPQQSVTLGANGLPTQPFRTNAVTTGLEFVY